MTTRPFFFMRAGERVNLVDPDPSMHPDDVRKLYASQHPELLNAGAVVYTEQDGKTAHEFLSSEGKVAANAKEIEFKPSIGKKG